MRFSLTSAALGLLLSSAALAQTPDRRVIIASQMSAQPLTRLYDANLKTGKVLAMPRFKVDGFAPLALSMDSIRRELILAVKFGQGSRVVRIKISAGKIVSEKVLGDLPGEVRTLVIGPDGDIFTSLIGSKAGIYRMPRNGGTPKMISNLPRITAMRSSPNYFGRAVTAQSGRKTPNTDPAIIYVDLNTGKQGPGARPLKNFPTKGITGIFETPTAVTRQVMSADNGRIYESVFSGPTRELLITPRLPAGATRRMRDQGGIQPLVMGGKAHPHIKSFTLFKARLVWTNLSVAIPGDPVDFDVMPAALAQRVFFGMDCSPIAARGPQIIVNSRPQLGSQIFQIGASRIKANSPAILVLGFDNVSFTNVQLPLTLTGNCLLHIRPDILGVLVADNRGLVNLPLPIPNNAALANVLFFAQWLEFQTGGIAASRAVGLHIGK